MSVTYRVQLFAFTNTSGNTGIGTLLAEFENARNIGYADYLNDVPEAFVTLLQDDPKIALIRGYEGRCHVRIWRNDDIVWTGWGAMETDANTEDVILYCFGYLAGLWWTTSGWNISYANSQIDTIVSAMWTRAKTTLTDSTLAFVTTGTIQAPVTTSGGAVAIVLPLYKMYEKRLLFCFRELAAISMSDTTNTVVFEITHSATPTFNFWKLRGTARPTLKWEYGGKYVQGYHDYKMAVNHRNDILAVGSSPTNPDLRVSGYDATDGDTWGRRQEPLYMSWVRDALELERAADFRTARSLRVDTDLSLKFYPNTVSPPGATDCIWRLSDSIPVKVVKGITNINKSMLVTGVQVLWVDGDERVNVLLQDPHA